LQNFDVVVVLHFGKKEGGRTSGTVLKFAVKQIQVLSFKMNFNLLAQVVALLHVYTGGIEGSKSYS